ncbi:MAG: hypothetical protein NW226_15340 [Microscillaceae bacterium]|nr:hypothetical protein [Microscillaceae bacterium]
MRKILLIEPNYKNKYPPIGLMKISTYHRSLGDQVTFFKGDLKLLVLEEIVRECKVQLYKIDSNIEWCYFTKQIREYITKSHLGLFDQDIFPKSKHQDLITYNLSYFKAYYQKKDYYKEPHWDRVYVATLFTFYWDITIKTIEEVKNFVKNPAKDIKIGGVMASLLFKEIFEATGIIPIKGLLDKAGILDEGNNIIIDELPLDYSILYEIDYEYPTQSAYFTFMTKGCTRKCAFCSVPKLEPMYKAKIETKEKFDCITNRFGEQHNLMLMDNNVLASPKFNSIIQEIKDMGFQKGATFIEPNYLDIAIINLEDGYNDQAFTRRVHKLLKALLQRLIKSKNLQNQAQIFFNILAEYRLFELDTCTKKNILEAYPKIKDIYEKYRNKSRKMRYVDFNQGTDCRYVTPEIMKLIAQIPIRPLRIAFDYLSLRPKYEKAVRLAAENGIKELSNYILYNFTDKPEDLYERLKINVDLSLELDIQIYSFPMKYIPLFGEDAKHRNYIGKHWNRKFIRAIQAVLNVTKGIVAPPHRNEKTSFFEKAFGRDLDEFIEILYMPETYIVYRSIFEREEITQMWIQDFREIQNDKKSFGEFHNIVKNNKFNDIEEQTKNPKVLNILKYYTIQRGMVDNDFNYSELKTKYKELANKYSQLIKKDKALERTLTYDFE